MCPTICLKSVLTCGFLFCFISSKKKINEISTSLEHGVWRDPNLQPQACIFDSRINHIFYSMEVRTVSFTDRIIGLYTLKLSPQNTSRYQELNLESEPCSTQQGWKLIRARICSGTQTQIRTSQNCPGTGPASIIPHDLSLTESAPVAQPHKGLPTSVTDSFKWTSERPPRNSDDICSLACQRLPRGVTWICEPRKGCPAAKRPSLSAKGKAHIGSIKNMKDNSRPQNRYIHRIRIMFLTLCTSVVWSSYE